jgi:hypothetical protein
MSKQFRRSDATKLDDKDIQNIINLRNSIPNAAMVASKLFKISATRVYQIWKSGTELKQHESAPDRVVSQSEAKKIIESNAVLFNIEDTATSGKSGKSESREHQSSSSTRDSRHEKERSSSHKKQSLENRLEETLEKNRKMFNK